MTACKRPWSVTALAVLYLAVGAAGLAYDLYSIAVSMAAATRWPTDLLLGALTEAAAILSGVFLLRGARWAPWLALAWIAVHVAISVGSFHKTAMHAVFLAVIAWGLFHRDARAYFQNVVRTAQTAA